MVITSELLVSKISGYLHGEVPLSELVDWAERSMMDGDIEEQDFDAIRDVIARLGVADVKEFGLSWHDCKGMLARLGYAAKFQIVPA